MQIENIQVKSDQAYTRISANIRGEELWFRLPNKYFNGSVADALLSSAFFPAMAQPASINPNDDAHVLSLPEQYPVSPKLMAAFPMLQDVFRSWCPRLQPISIVAEPEKSPKFIEGTASMFSGGVDSVYTVLKHKDEITHLVYIAGYEHVLDEEALARTTQYLTQFAETYNKLLIVVETNQIDFFTKLKIGRDIYHGNAMAAVAHLLGFEKVYIPSSDAYSELQPWGSHALTDPVWSSDSVQIVYDGGPEGRIDKIDYLDKHSDAMQHVLVCWNEAETNCCVCNKCLRTMIAMQLLNIHSPKFPKPLQIKNIRQARFKTAVDSQLFTECLDGARTRGNHQLVRAMAWAESRVHIVNALKKVTRSLDDLILGGILQRRATNHKQQQWYTIPVPKH
ncbi:MAG: hypothetical protein KUG75_00900 [Pseudomonadales bacterium]|nr:hypothetical protein [Pseudomonadales bacterium]